LDADVARTLLIDRVGALISIRRERGLRLRKHDRQQSARAETHTQVRGADGGSTMTIFSFARPCSTYAMAFALTIGHHYVRNRTQGATGRSRLSAGHCGDIRTYERETFA
jgi:hypothetical protein